MAVRRAYSNLRPCLNVQIESVHNFFRQNLSKIKLCDCPNKLDNTIWQVLNTTESVGWTIGKNLSTDTFFLFYAGCCCCCFLHINRSGLNHVCVCVFFPFILDIRFVGRTSRGHTGGRSDRISHPPSFCGACLNFSREKDSAIPFPRRL